MLGSPVARATSACLARISGEQQACEQRSGAGRAVDAAGSGAAARRADCGAGAADGGGSIVTTCLGAEGLVAAGAGASAGAGAQHAKVTSPANRRRIDHP